MSLFSNPKILYFVRIAQLLFGIAFLVLVCYDGTHRAWWNNINGPLAVGVISSIFTLAITAHSIFTHHRSNPFSGGSNLYTIARLVAEILVFLLWVASAALMLRPRGGCENKGAIEKGKGYQFEGQQACYRTDNGDYMRLYSDQPIKTWIVAIALALIEAVTFIATVVMVFLDDRKSKVSGGTSYA
ncbi:MAG: hypothetical protein Q9223_003835 [Gallowayella weberi]